MTALLLATLALSNQKLRAEFATPPDSARPWVHGYFMEGNVTRAGMTANVWANRLIGDSALPESQRVTHTTWQPYRPQDALQPSGLLGPVRLLQ